MNLQRSLSRKRQTFRVDVRATASGQHVRHLKTKLHTARALLKSSHLKELSVALVGDRQMSALHERFMKIKGPTDVMTFPLEHDARGRVISGEVVVCLPEARRRVRQLGTKLRDELLLYALHGMLHLSGFDDRTDRQYHRMHRMEDQILRRLGVGAVFGPNKSKLAGKGWPRR
jgi:probable rRNA maturation factor